MAHSLSAKKRIRQNLKRRARNRARKERVKTQIKAFNATLATGDATAAEQELRKAVQLLDRTAAKGTIHKNAAARKRSRLTRRLNAVRSGAVKPSAVAHGKAVKSARATGGSAPATTAGAGTGGATA